jgi:hypothetical protein
MHDVTVAGIAYLKSPRATHLGRPVDWAPITAPERYPAVSDGEAYTFGDKIVSPVCKRNDCALLFTRLISTHAEEPPSSE